MLHSTFASCALVVHVLACFPHNADHRARRIITCLPTMQMTGVLAVVALRTSLEMEAPPSTFTRMPCFLIPDATSFAYFATSSLMVNSRTYDVG